MSIRNNLFDDLMVTKSVFCYNCLYSMDMYYFALFISLYIGPLLLVSVLHCSIIIGRAHFMFGFLCLYLSVFQVSRINSFISEEWVTLDS